MEMLMIFFGKKKIIIENRFLKKGYCKRFVLPFKLSISGSFHRVLTQEEIIQEEEEARRTEEEYNREMLAQDDDWWYREMAEEADDGLILRVLDRNKKEEELTINDLRTFKIEQCVICLENIPNVLFCNCGHICVCESCIMKFNNCPVCKKENTILRIIE